MRRINRKLLVNSHDAFVCLFVLALSAVLACAVFFPPPAVGHAAVDGEYKIRPLTALSPVPDPRQTMLEIGFRATPAPSEIIPVRKITWNDLSHLETLLLAQPPVLPDVPAALEAPMQVPDGCEASTNPGFERELFDLLNAERQQRGLGLLTWNDDLARAARKHSLDMACRGYFSHTSLDAVYFDQRVSAEGYSFYAVGETLFGGDGVYNSPAQAFNGWYNSTDHFNVMTHPVLTEVGIGYVYSPGSRHGGYFTADYATPE
jgi:uncharacterized protein YkwD